MLHRQVPEQTTANPAGGKRTNLGIGDSEGGNNLVSEAHPVSDQPAGKTLSSSCRQKAPAGEWAQHLEASPSCVLKARSESQKIRFRPVDTRTHTKEYLIAAASQAVCPQKSTCATLAVNGIDTEALLDSGSTTTLIDTKWAATCSIQWGPLKDGRQWRGPSGHLLKPVGCSLMHMVPTESNIEPKYRRP